VNFRSFLVLWLLIVAGLCLARQSRLYIASQHNWEGKRGFYIDFENSSEGEVCHLANLSLVLAIADGEKWRFLSFKPQWQSEKEYSLKAEINRETARIWLDGNLLGESRGGFLPADIGERKEGFVPADEVIWLNYIPLVYRGRQDYLVLLKDIQLESGNQKLSFSFPQSTPLFLFEPQCPKRLKWKTEGEIRINAHFKIISYPELKSLSPFIDRYGQCRYAEWEGKIKSDEDLKRAWEKEREILKEWGEPKGYDRFGGYELLGWKEKGTGFYRVIKRDGYWWLITPEGNPCFYFGLCVVPPAPWEIMTPVSGREFLFEWLPSKKGIYSEAWGKGYWGENEKDFFCFHYSNMIRKYGKDWRKLDDDITRRRLKAWGFSGVGKWGKLEGMPYFPVLGRGDVPSLVSHPDIFDEKIREKFREALRSQIEPGKSDPYIVGWSLGNEYDEIISREEIGEIMKKGDDVPAKRAFVDFALKKIYKGDIKAMVEAWGSKAEEKEKLYGEKLSPPRSDLEELRRFYSEKYYEFVYKTIKELDPNHLFLGFWMIPSWWEDEDYWEIFKISAKYCDVIGYNLGAYEFMSERFKRFVEEVDKPIICGDFSFPAFYNGERGFGLWDGIFVRDDVEAGEYYQRWIREGAEDPYCVGFLWFLYRDQPITGRGPCGIDIVTMGPQPPDLVCCEHYAFGLVDVTDTPKWELVRRVREANLSAVKLRAGKR